MGRVVRCTVGGVEYELCDNRRTRYDYEVVAGRRFESSPLWRVWLDEDGKPYAGDEVRLEYLSDIEIPHVVLAFLNGARAVTKSRRHPWTLDEVLLNVLGPLDDGDVMKLLAACFESGVPDPPPGEGVPEAAEPGKAAPAG